jgi:hypothetical protein
MIEKVRNGMIRRGGVFIIDQRMTMGVMGSEDEGFTALYSESVGFVLFFTMYWNFFSNWG